MSADKLISLLPKVKRMGRLRWTARCPSHNDKVPSLAVRELDDGRVLVHCFAGCSTGDILAAIGLTMEDLFPERQSGYSSTQERRPFYALDVLRCVAFEALLVAMIANNMANGKELSEEDRKRLKIAAGRLQAAEEVANGE